ncbi:metal-dependent hydrolase [Deinococcus taeanensis]|uniref:metal-dependent hydrolase n=1 Tax=Deinococcus taeanensis TaxID=2737050 RepID=UPI001CDB54B3|nr:metal-dependent hydrolase [Deinococcus taeanensis]UBV42649.1 metal-dependent hydrolase [Deinococcus taeanensis]
MNIHFIGHSTFMLETQQHRLLIDPFIQGNPQASVTLQQARDWQISAVLISHAHGDHWGDALEFARAGTPLIATVEIAGYAQKHGATQAIGMNIGGTYRAEWGSVTLTPAWHSSSFPDGTYGGMPTGLIITLGGQRVYFAGDTNLFSDMRLIGDTGLDAALLPIGDHFTMGPEEAARTLDLLRPRVAVPMHYGTFPPLTGDPAVFRREGEARGVDVRVLKPGEHTTL